MIEAGFAISSPGDFESVETIARTVKGCTVASLARAAAGDIDAAWDAVKKAADPRIHLFIATSPLHMQYKLRMKPEEVLEKAAAMVAYAKKYLSLIHIWFSMAEALLSSPIMARVSVVGETSMIDARKMFAIWMTRFPISLVGTLTLMRISSRRMAFSGCSSFTECTGSSLRS